MHHGWPRLLAARRGWARAPADQCCGRAQKAAQRAAARTQRSLGGTLSLARPPAQQRSQSTTLLYLAKPSPAGSGPLFWPLARTVSASCGRNSGELIAMMASINWRGRTAVAGGCLAVLNYPARCWIVLDWSHRQRLFAGWLDGRRPGTQTSCSALASSFQFQSSGPAQRRALEAETVAGAPFRHSNSLFVCLAGWLFHSFSSAACQRRLHLLYPWYHC